MSDQIRPADSWRTRRFRTGAVETPLDVWRCLTSSTHAYVLPSPCRAFAPEDRPSAERAAGRWRHHDNDHDQVRVFHDRPTEVCGVRAHSRPRRRCRFHYRLRARACTSNQQSETCALDDLRARRLRVGRRLITRRNAAASGSTRVSARLRSTRASARAAGRRPHLSRSERTRSLFPGADAGWRQAIAGWRARRRAAGSPSLCGSPSDYAETEVRLNAHRARARPTRALSIVRPVAA